MNLIFSAFSSTKLAHLVAGGKNRIVYAAPGMQTMVAQAFAELAGTLIRPEITISLDLDEHTLRMGYGSVEAVDCLLNAKIEIMHSPGFRCGILIVDDRGWIFSPVPLYLEAEPQSDETPNAIELSKKQVADFVLRFSPQAKQAAIQATNDPFEAEQLELLPVELGVAPVSREHIKNVKAAIKAAPPACFDVVRQVRVFEPYLQYVDLHLTGAAMQKHRVPIPDEIQRLGGTESLEGRLKTTFDLLKKSSDVSSKALENRLNQIRKNFTRTLGNSHGRVVLKSSKPTMELRIEEFRAELEEHQKNVAEKLQEHINESMNAVVEFYLPTILKNPPDAVIGQSLNADKPEEDDVRKWLQTILKRVFPKAENLIRKMSLDVTFKDVTFETLNREDFLEQVKKAYPNIDWDKAYKDFRAAGEKEKSK